MISEFEILLKDGIESKEIDRMMSDGIWYYRSLASLSMVLVIVCT